MENDYSLIGKTALVTGAIKDGDLGEIRVEVGGGFEDYLALAANPDDSIPARATVTIVAKLANRTVTVKAA